MCEVVRLVDQYLIDEMLSLHESGLLLSHPALTGRRVGDPQEDGYRKTKRVMMSHRMFPEICERIEGYFEEDLKVNQFDYLIYNVGDRYKKHTDAEVGDEDAKRVYTTVTMLDKSDDLEGGNLVVYNDDGSVVTINLGIGDTAIFRSNLVHEATEVIRGTRKVLVAWLF